MDKFNFPVPSSPQNVAARVFGAVLSPLIEGNKTKLQAEVMMAQIDASTRAHADIMATIRELDKNGRLSDAKFNRLIDLYYST